MEGIDGMKSRSDVTIRRTDDIEEVLRLNSLLFRKDEELNVSGNTYHWLCRDKQTGKSVGFCSCTDAGYRNLFLSRAGLLRNYRGFNLQKTFILIRESFARRRGFERVITYTTYDNYQSIANLIKSGYKLYEPEWKYVGPEFLYYIKHINT